MNDTNILLVNSYAPRQRVISDTALENSLTILRTYVEAKGFKAEVVDDQRINLLEAGVPGWCKWILRGLTRLQLQFLKFKILVAVLLVVAWPVHALAIEYRRQYMRQRIRKIVKKVTDQNIPFLGIKLWYGEAYQWSGELAAAVRRQCPETVIVAGGPQVKVYGDFVLDTDSFDLAVMGPGEEVLAKLLDMHRSYPRKDEFLQAVQAWFGGLLIKTGGYDGSREGLVRQLAGQTIPRYRESDLEDKILFHTLVDGVGCSWNKCSFCSHSRCGVAYTPRPVMDIIAEIKTMLGYGIAFFRFSSSETTLAQGRKVAAAILASGLSIRFSMFVRATRPTKATLETYRLLIRAGLRAVFMGGETGHDVVNREIMNKGVVRQDIIDTIATIRLAADAEQQSCRVGLSLIYPCPLPADVGLEEVYQANVTLIDETLPDTVIVNPPGPFPETRWFEEAERFGISFKDGPSAFVRKLMQYEYSIYKPAELWPDIGCLLQGKEAKYLLKETGRLRAYAAGIGIPTDISDEYLMMTDAIGLSSRRDLLEFKRNSLLDIISGSAGYTREIAAAINEASRRLAAANQAAIDGRREAAATAREEG